jgi:hypothetical protein
MERRRWEGDSRGYGIANAVLATANLLRLSAEMAAPDWVAEAPDEHLLPHLREFVERTGSPWRLVAAEAAPDGTYVVHVAWTGERASRRSLRAEAFALIGAIAESSTHVREQRDGDSLVYEIVTGMLDGDSGWRGHGHVLRLRIDEPAADADLTAG